MAEPVLDKSSPIPRVTWGFFIGFCVLLVAGAQFKMRMDDTVDRQQKYIERRDAQHAAHQEWSEGSHRSQQDEIARLESELEETHGRIDAMCQELAARWGEVICE